MRGPVMLLVASAALAGAVAASSVSERGTARAAGSTIAAIVGGVDASATGTPELVVWNLGPQPLTLDVLVRDATGNAIANAAGTIEIPTRGTVTDDVKARLRAGLAKGAKPYAGFVSVELRQAASDVASSFSSDTAIVHVTQYYGSRKAPKAAFVLRPLYRDEAP